MARRIVQLLNELSGSSLFLNTIDCPCQEEKTCCDLPEGLVVEGVGRND
jgi:hypothetical protein